MRKKKIMLFLSSLCLLLTSCSQHDEVEDNTAAQPMSWAEEVSKMVTDFNSPSYSRNHDDSPIEIVEIRRQNYYVDSDTIYPVGEEEVVDNTSSTITRETRTATKDIIPVGTVKYIRNGDTGFSVLVNDPKLKVVYMNILKGEVNDTARIPAMKMYMANIPNFVKDQLTRIDKGLSPFMQGDGVIGSGGVIKVSPFTIPNLTATAWGQGAPYNNYAPECKSKCGNCLDGRFPIGCATTALAQFIAKCGKFNGTFYGNKDIPFSTLASKRAPVTQDEKNRVAQFFHEIALNIQIKFGHGGSSTSMEPVGDYLKELGYTCELVSGAIAPSTLKASLDKGIPIIVRGQNSDGVGHEWLVTGLKYDGKLYYYYCNWGFDGIGNGEVMGNYYTMDDRTGFNKKHRYLNVTKF